MNLAYSEAYKLLKIFQEIQERDQYERKSFCTDFTHCTIGIFED